LLQHQLGVLEYIKKSNVIRQLWSMGENRLKVFESKVLRRIFARER
jgi:hypothetical protein